MKKDRWIALSVTTEEALRISLEEQSPVIAVETPLYPKIKNRWTYFEGIEDYEGTEYTLLNCIILIKVRGQYPFDNQKYEICYFPFSKL